MATTKIRPTYRRLWALLALPLMLVLASCEMKMHTEFFEDETGQVSAELALPKAQADMFGVKDCEMLSKEMSKQDAPEGVKISDKSNDSELRCVMETSKMPISDMTDDLKAEVKDGKYIVTSKSAGGPDPAMLEGLLSGGDFSFKFTFPGKVESVTGAAKDTYTINGNSVDFTKPTALASGFVVTASAKPGAGSSNLWLILGVIVALAVIGAIVFFLLKSRKKPAAPAAPYGAPPVASDPATPYGASAPSTGAQTLPYAAPGPDTQYAYGDGAPAENQPYASPAAPDSPFSPYGNNDRRTGPGTDPLVAPADPNAPGAPQPPAAPEHPVAPRHEEPTDPALGFTEPRAGEDPNDPNRA